MSRAVILIPAFEPKAVLIKLIQGLFKTIVNTDFEIVIVNDGSKQSESLSILDQVKKLKKVTLINHIKNVGKGGALKSGFSHVSKFLPQAEFVVTADADGQHLPSDISKILEHAIIRKSPVVGVRIFDKQVPLRSLLGNKLTRWIFRAIFRTDVKDTQTGLRAIPKGLIEPLSKISQVGYDYELEMLIQLVKRDDIVQLPITTVYEPGNPSSHFRPLVDSLKIYAVFFRHTILSLVGTLLYFTLFQLSLLAGLSIFSALTLSRGFSILYFFPVARKFVFKSGGSIYIQALLYVILVVVNFILLWLFITTVSEIFGIPKLFGLILGQVILYFTNFWIEEKVIFKSKKNSER